MLQKRKLVIFRNYYHEFYKSQNENVREKVNYVLFLITIADRLPSKFFKHIKGAYGLYEIRVEFESNFYRIFCCFDEGNLVILFNGFTKKSRMTPKKEITKALKIKDEYFREKINYG
ncbi:MAG: type II toxin-antitoxin system RelE/ParE family toxin [Bacteroidales bacterium]|nr:type II toxin-antitoxin system RelE/ParE family toxin [Bacteroidales bacterium]